MRINYKQVFLTTVALSATSIRSLEIGGGFGGDGKLSLGGVNLGFNMSANTDINFDGLYAKAHLNLTGDIETIDFNQSAFRSQMFGMMNNSVTMGAQFVDEMAEIRVFRPKMDHNLSRSTINNWALHRLVGAREINTTGTDTLALFDNNNSSWSDAMNGTYNGMSCSIRQINGFFTFVSNASIRVSVNVTAYIFNQDYAIAINGKNVTASLQTVKYTYSVGSWPFTANSLGLAVFGIVKSTGTGNSTSGAGVVVAGEAKLMIPTIAEADNATVDISASLQIVGVSNTMRSAMIIQFSFPVYNNTLVYDPALGMQDETMQTTTTQMPATTASSATTAAATENSTSKTDSSTAATGGVSNVAFSMISTVLMLALAMINA